MKLPRDVSGAKLGKALRVLGYERTRQRGSHMRYTTQRRALPIRKSLLAITITVIHGDTSAIETPMASRIL